jgi:hypothetical protein
MVRTGSELKAAESRICRESVEKNEAWSKYDKNNGYFTWRPVYIYDNMWTNSS